MHLSKLQYVNTLKQKQFEGIPSLTFWIEVHYDMKKTYFYSMSVYNICIFFAGASEGLRFALYLAYIHIRS